jgi:hypothetical protein
MSIPTHEVSIKEALVLAGKLDKSRAGKGKPSRQMVADADELVKKGWKIKGRTLVSTPANAEPAKVAKVAGSGGKEIADIGPPRRDDREWEAYANVDGKEVAIGMRTVCNGPCGNSLTYCWCSQSTVFLDFDQTAVVNFRQRRV